MCVFVCSCVCVCVRGVCVCVCVCVCDHLTFQLQHLYHITVTYADSKICEFWPKKAILNVHCMRDFIYARLYMGCGYSIIDRNFLFNFSFTA